MKKKFIAVILALAAIVLPFSGCESTGFSEEPPESGATQIFQRWNTDVPFKLLVGKSTEVDVVVKSSLESDHEKARKAASNYIDLEETESLFEGKEMRWVKCTADISIDEASEYSVLDIAFACYLDQYQKKGVGFGYFYYNYTTGQYGSSSNENLSSVILFKQSNDLRSCQAIIYAYIPVDDDSCIMKIARCVGSDTKFECPEIPNEAVLCWKISDGLKD